MQALVSVCVFAFDRGSAGEHHMDMQENIHKTRIIAGSRLFQGALVAH
jgi:hypothetical protein